MVDSIQSSRDQSPALDTSSGSSVSPNGNDISPTTRRNRDLAQALFGREEAEREEQEATTIRDLQANPQHHLHQNLVKVLIGALQL